MKGSSNMNEEKIKLILEAMQGITYSEWKKLSHIIDVTFKAEADNQSNKIEIASPEKIVNNPAYKGLF